VHAGVPFEKKGGAELSLPKMDLPIGLVEWEVFLPQRYKVSDFGGDAISARLLPADDGPQARGYNAEAILTTKLSSIDNVNPDLIGPGQIGGIVRDPSGAAVPRAMVVALHIDSGATLRTVTDSGGRWVISNVPSGRIRTTVVAAGFRNAVYETDYDARQSARFSHSLQIGSITETVEVIGSAPQIQSESQQVNRSSRQNSASTNSGSGNGMGSGSGVGPSDSSPSVNVTELQRRVVGVLPIGMSVPRAGTAYHFARPLVVDEETKLTFSYRSK
jgi:hypothetical protein